MRLITLSTKYQFTGSIKNAVLTTIKYRNQSTRVSGIKAKKMAEEKLSGRMGHFMKGIGWMISRMERAG